MSNKIDKGKYSWTMLEAWTEVAATASFVSIQAQAKAEFKATAKLDKSVSAGAL